ncbi:PA-phosphatase related-family protein [Trichinella spiralis]|uniref:PA-phosphatase related-family protein n=1 Tax=Trichinella spiralis TaxID=6334 RepID=A0ABR3K9Y2_TRISP
MCQDIMHIKISSSSQSKFVNQSVEQKNGHAIQYPSNPNGEGRMDGQFIFCHALLNENFHCLSPYVKRCVATLVSFQSNLNLLTTDIKRNLSKNF